MNLEDVGIYVFLVSMVVTAIEFLIFGIMKIIELYATNLNYFYLSLAAPVIAVVSLVLLLVKG
jgi:hypothetical protein